MRELTPCQGWDDNKAIIPTQFYTEAEYISVCGHLEVNQASSISLVAEWFYEDNFVFDEVVKGRTGFVSHYIRPENGFQPGTYRVDIFGNSRLIRTTEFQVQ